MVATDGWWGVMEPLLEWLGDNASLIAVGVLGTVVAALINRLFGSPVSWWQRRQDKQAAREALKSEIDSNLTQLAALWGDINKPAGTFHFEPRPLTPDLTAAFRLSGMAPIRWRRANWEDRAGKTVAALEPDELALVSAVYDDLDRLDVLKGSLGNPIPTLDHNYRLSDGGMYAWESLRKLVARRLAEGNPLDQPAK
jgi:hypothetical protein